MIATTQVRERPILFSGPMVRAILEGRKFQTRRVVDMDRLRVRLPFKVTSDIPVFVQPERVADRGTHPAGMNQHGAVWAKLKTGEPLGLRPGEFDFVCPYVVGTTRHRKGQGWHIEPHGSQRLWVRETFYCDVPHDDPKRSQELYFRADVPSGRFEDAGYWAEPGPSCWKPAIHMPRWASRITLEITDVRVQRLTQITEEDARAEGVECERVIGDWWGPNKRARAEDAFAELWNDIHGDGAWDLNPFVWALTFRRVEAGHV